MLLGRKAKAQMCGQHVRDKEMCAGSVQTGKLGRSWRRGQEPGYKKLF